MTVTQTRIDRRELLRRLALAGVSLPFAGSILAACSRDAGPAAGDVRFGPLPLHPEDPAIAGGMPIERNATLRVFEWKDYLSASVIAAFERRFADHGVRVHVESFLHIDEGVAKLAAPGAEYDVFFPTVDVLAGLVDARLLRPLNHDYLTHRGNLWPWFVDGAGPFYDPGQRYTLPYTVFSSGVGWRDDLVSAGDAPDVTGDPYGLLWNPDYRGRLGMYDQYVDAIALALLRDGVTDVRAAGDDQLAEAADALERAVREAGVRFTVDGAEEGLAEGTFAAHQAWSGDVLTARRYAEADGEEGASRLRYLSPGPARVVGLDLTAVGARGRNPVLAHAFLDHLLRFDVAMDNFTWNGYQPPLNGATREAFADPTFRWRDAVPANLREAIIEPAEFAAGQMLVGFGPSERARWLAQWNRVVPA
jgi:spermidine/putrescine transport system substrate-binding protein